MQSKHDWIDAVVTDIQQVTKDVKAIELSPAAGSARTYSAGSHIKVEVKIDGRTKKRTYSLTNLPNGKSYKIAVKLANPGNGGSKYMHELTKNARLKITHPLNEFELYRHAAEQPHNQVVLIAGGIGITPIFAQIQALKTYGVNCELHYTAKSDEDFCFKTELSSILGPHLHLYVSQRNRLNLEKLLKSLPLNGAVYFCGPNAMLEEAQKIWKKLNRHFAGFRFETFGSSGQYPPEPFEVKIPSLNKTLVVPVNKTMMDVMNAAGIYVMHDCKRGECGLCALDVLEVNGTIDHRDVFFSERQKEENAQMCACVSRVVGGSVTIDTFDRPDEV